MKKILTILIALTITIVAEAQKTEISFSENSHYFGNIPEKEGQVEYKFTYTNKGTAPLVINEIRTGCDCTSCEWKKEPIAPGQSGTITAIFDPEGLPGKFIKSIAVFANTTPSVHTLTVRGYVIPQKSGPFDNYPIKMGHLRLDNDNLDIQILNRGEAYKKEIAIINSSKESLDIEATIATEGIDTEVFPKQLAPMESGKLTISWKTNNKTPLGPVDDQINIIHNGQIAGVIPMCIDIHEDFSMYKNGYESAPLVDVGHIEGDLGAIKSGELVLHDFVIGNAGKSELHIRKIVCKDPNVTAVMKKGIKPGKSRKLNITVQANGEPSLRSAEILLYTNAPNNPVIAYTLYYEIM